MTNETQRNDERGSDSSDLRRFESGQRADDRESEVESQVLVLGARGQTAEECYVSAINQTVAEVNPEYPASDPVADVAFVEGIEDALGLDWSADDVLQLAADGDLGRARIKHYAYPESRLAPREEEEESG
jgi:hypothetical protein